MVQKIKVFTSLLVSLSLLVIWSCDETTEFEKGELFNPQVQGQIASDTLYAELDTTYSINKPNTRSADRLMVGSFAGLQCRPILKFIDLPPSDVTITKGHIKFITASITGDNPQPFTVKAHPILNDWTTNTDMIWNDYLQNIDTTKTLGSINVTISDNDTILMPLDSLGLKYFNKWIKDDSTDFNYGFILQYANANFIKEFNSNRNQQGPRVILEYNFPGDTTLKDSAYSTSDAFLIEGDFTRQSGVNYVSSFAPWVTLLKFNTNDLIDKFPEGFVVETANLQLTIDKSNSFIDSEFGVYFNILKLSSDLESNEVAVDSSVLGSPSYTIDMTNLSDDSSYVQVNAGTERRDFGQYLLQDRIDDPQTVKKLYVGFKNNIDFLSYIALYKRNHPDLDKRPRLIIEYWIPPSPRF